MQLNGAVTIVTGAARGIGRQVAQTLAEQGARVALADVLVEELHATAEVLKDAGASVLPAVTDVTDVAQVDALVTQVRETFGPVDVLINNAGTFSYIGPVWEADPERWFRDIRVNLYGGFLMCRAVVGEMVERGSGYVINTVSSGGVGDPHPYCTSYASSKTGLMRLTEGLAREVTDRGVCVFAIGPPAILTEMTRFIMDDPGGRRWRPGFGRIFERGNAHTPEVVANFILELLSGKADHLTGRYFLPHEPLEPLLERSAEILEHDLLTLRIRR